MKMLNKVLPRKCLKPSNGRSKLRAYGRSLFAAGITSIALFGVEGYAASNTNLYTAAPPFVAESIGKPNVVIALDISGSMKQNAYYDTSGSGNWKSKIQSDFDPTKEYFGYFESGSRYSYDYSLEKRFFVQDEAGAWDGNFLNWATMRRMDVVRKVLVGGKVRDRDGETLAGESPWYVIEGQNEPADYEFKKSYSASSGVSLFPDDSVMLISDGKISAYSSATSRGLALSDELEIGVVNTSRDKSDDSGSADDADWVSVEYINTYSSAPSVVASSLSYHGSDPVHARVRNVTTSGFEVRLEEWDYRDVNHTTEDITYIVADNTATHKFEVDGTDYEFQAGVISTNIATGSVPNFNTQALTASGYTPVVFTGVSSQNNSQPVVTRTRNVGSTGFEVALQNEDKYVADSGSHPASEDIHWIAIQPVSGISDFVGTAIEIGSTGNSVDESFKDVSFSNSDFLADNEPIVGVNMQTFNGSDTAYARYQNPSNTGFEVKIEEEQSYDSEVAHANESVGYIAVDSSAGFNIKIGVRAEPEGIVQQNSGSLRFGVAVYNYDHSRDPTSVYTGNTVDGGTLWPCYPDVSLEPAERTNFDICLPTHVKAPLSNIIDVIEDHPLIWGSTPIAETLYDIRGYFGQNDLTATRGHEQWYDNGTEGLAGTAKADGLAKERPSYEVNNDWDPYYYDDFENRVPCAKSFVLHFNDGAPYKDFQDMDLASSPHPTVADDGVGSYGTNEVLDDLALELRSIDCRDESGTAPNNTGTDGFAQMTGHQDIVSYYVYAALGVNEDLNNSTRRMREAAVNGGFVDSDGDNEPDPNHNLDGAYSNINDYISAGDCPETEWDSDGDCNPDTFYFANDGAELVDELNAAFESIVTRAATGGASAVVSASQSGEGNIVNAIFRPTVSSGSDTVTWIGDVHALMIDSGGNIRQDDGDRVLGTTAQDPYLDMCTDTNEQLVRVKTSTDDASRPTTAQMAACSGTVFPLDLFDIDYLWSASEWLSDLTDTEVTTQRSYTSTNDGRYIITGIDSDGSGIVQESEVVDFEGTNFPKAYAGLLADDYDDAQNVLTYIRGEDIDGYRSRQLDGKTMRLGDVIYSIPTSVGRPAENLDLLYQSESYAKFLDRYKNRRQVIYSGANDGMLHAFNGGWYDSDTKTFKNAEGASPGSTTNYALGEELWAYVPYNLLPHLEYLTQPTYGSISSDHLYFVDLEPRVFDAKIFPRTGSTADAEKYPGLSGDAYGWGTILVVGMRLGGGETTVDANLNAGTTDSRTLRSSIMIFDVTDPDEPPRLLLEYTHPDLGFTTSLPAPITVGTDSDGNGDWYLLLGSGPDTDREGFTNVESTQNAKLFLLNLIDVAEQKSTVLETNFGTNGIATLSEANSFVSEITPVDFGLDNFTTDAVYFGTVSGSHDTAWDGNLYRMKIQANTGETPLSVSSWTPEVMLDVNAPISAAITPTTDSNRNKWLFFGTGRLFTTADNLDDSTQNYFFGVKEPRDTAGSFTYNSIATASIVDVTDVEVSAANGTISSTPSALTDGDQVSVVENQMRQYSDSTKYLSGWRRTFDSSERNFGAASALGGTLTFTTFVPDVLECSIEGDAYLYALNALTGTAGADPILAQDDAATVNGYVVNIGSSPATTPSLHRGEGYDTDNKTTAILQSANGNIISIEQDNEEKARDGEASWRQLR